ncbi:patatin-like phospholipase family protein [Legionella maioricensis]|uniref:Patatin-like phospholipase family protein n=1 Tax=Legionella maioricensis TaxID=2896528 RepID=A0A9X2I897_9GAMM|nr:patatin-like phospholipase family protein [Legionella maioricensis]MCL9682654.1 patatin-like phospholipase family protein [Legionella maioricensis]MCL9687299.1 patatin-like phospholipase family protein [Legionella maioricensis]
MPKKSGTTGRSNTKKKVTLIDLALQGGGAHGAYTWGVLDRLLEEPGLLIEGISGTSAGSMNAAVLVNGYVSGGANGAREALTSFWKRVSEAARFSPFQRGPLDILSGNWTMDNSPLFVAFDITSRLFSPYDLNPIDLNPLRNILEESINFPALIKSPIKLFITATNVKTGRGRVFRNQEITPDVLLASACLPSMFQAIEIDGEAYWDGGYTGNPTITPLIQECESSDTVLVQINPIERPGTPKSARDILNRLNEVAFNATLMKELRMIALLRKTAHLDLGEGARWAKMRIHRITSSKMVELGYSSKLNAEWSFLRMLFEEGRSTTDAFLNAHGKALNNHSTLDLDSFL